MNLDLFDVKSIAPHVSLGRVFIGVVPPWIVNPITPMLRITFPSNFPPPPNTMIGSRGGRSSDNEREASP